MSNICNLDKLIQIVEQETAIIVYFYNDDCPPCISLRPKVEGLINSTFPKIKLIWVNSKSYPEIPANYNVFANPTILVFFEGKEFKRFSKYVSISELEQAIDRYYKLVF
ncbi:MAG: thioredoxin family protein [Bacteroidales bacterium]|nr:thioredoxin family protein [Bacteroidales bacterium]